MKTGQIITSILGLILILTGCSEAREKSESIENDGWRKVGQVEKTIRNIHFTFPDSGFVYKNREDLVKESFDALDNDSELIGLSEFNDTIFIRFLPSRQEMFPLTGATPKGSAYPHINTLYVVANEHTRPPIKHELMHLIAMLEWDYPPPTSTWMNEGLGTLAENNCSGWTVAEIYSYFLENDKLIPMDSLTSDFYKHPENFSYHQSAYLVAYLLNKYEIGQFVQLWKSGFEKFEEIYGVPFETVQADLEKDLRTTYPTAPEIDAETFYKDCE